MDHSEPCVGPQPFQERRGPSGFQLPTPTSSPSWFQVHTASQRGSGPLNERVSDSFSEHTHTGSDNHRMGAWCWRTQGGSQSSVGMVTRLKVEPIVTVSSRTHNRSKGTGMPTRPQPSCFTFAQSPSFSLTHKRRLYCVLSVSVPLSVCLSLSVYLPRTHIQTSKCNH